MSNRLLESGDNRLTEGGDFRLLEGDSTPVATRPAPLVLVQGTTAEIKVGDTARMWTATLAIDGTPVPLSGATITYRMRQSNPLVAGEETALLTFDIVSEDDGTVEYQPLDADVATAASFNGEFLVLFSDNSALTLPENGYILMRINPALP